jgi:hypothetical protein
MYFKIYICAVCVNRIAFLILLPHPPIQISQSLAWMCRIVGPVNNTKDTAKAIFFVGGFETCCVHSVISFLFCIYEHCIHNSYSLYGIYGNASENVTVLLDHGGG